VRRFLALGNLRNRRSKAPEMRVTKQERNGQAAEPIPAQRGTARPKNRRQFDQLSLAAALEYVRDQWPILPLSEAGDRLVCGMCPHDADMAREWWSDAPYGIAGLVGQQFDALDVSQQFGQHMLDKLTQPDRPISVIEVPLSGRWMFLVTPGAPAMTGHTRYRKHLRMQRDGWISLPPTMTPSGRVTWISRGLIPHSLIAQAVAHSLASALWVSATVNGTDFDL
jgi:Bifunctional DNA primase/polymerase, N-terminal